MRAESWLYTCDVVCCTCDHHLRQNLQQYETFEQPDGRKIRFTSLCVVTLHYYINLIVVPFPSKMCLHLSIHLILLSINVQSMWRLVDIATRVRDFRLSSWSCAFAVNSELAVTYFSRGVTFFCQHHHHRHHTRLHGASSSTLPTVRRRMCGWGGL